ncbi:hypothetical protein NIES4103_03070 [Nostoc sp. NIES-4103]|nr:hypothetical protein NIES4103_03070 [Nostoc sp. NIES-4103]
MNSNLVREKISILNKVYKVSLKQSLKFELKSLFGRIFYNSEPTLSLKSKNLLNLGSGRKKIENWINADFFSDLIWWKKSSQRPDWMLDLRYPLNCKDNVWDGVFSSHTLEHLYPDEALQLLKELNRTMKPGAWLRITVPDLRKYVAYYRGEKVDEEFTRRWQTGCEAIRTMTQNYIHVSVWDSELLGIFLKEAGFINIKEVSFMQGTDELLLKDLKDRDWESLYMEAQKPRG